MAVSSFAGYSSHWRTPSNMFDSDGKLLTFLVLLGLILNGCLVQSQDGNCYDYQRRAERCTPEFVNAAYNLPVQATNVCGLTQPMEYCLQTGVTGASKSCQYCDSRAQGRDHSPLDHSPKFMTDYESSGNWTWWQSETMLQDIQYPTVVNLTLNLKKSFDITYVKIRFYSSRPESFAVYKRTTEDGPWMPYQFYSASCERTYGLRTRETITPQDEAKALCTDEFSDISPLTGGTVAFSTLEGRPGREQFDTNRILQDFVTATEIKIVLTRLNTFGDEVFGDPQVLKSYFYAISELSVGARCKCNGHASKCIKVTSQGLEERLICDCQHKTMGIDCEECLPFYNDRPWARATLRDGNQCLPCNCNGKSEECYFDKALYESTGHGGHCTNCRDHAAGPNCERCKVNHYRRVQDNRCVPCGCDKIGSFGLQCNLQGRCLCKPGVAGDRCDRCEVNHYDFGNYGCRSCSCNEAGSLDNVPNCNTETGACSCKQNVDGQNCERCKNGFFGLDKENPFGCIACFCYGHSSACNSAPGYTARPILSSFINGRQKWKAVDEQNLFVETKYDGLQKNIAVSSPGSGTIYFLAPARYLGDQRFSYNQYLTFNLRIGEQQGRPSRKDVVLEGAQQTVSIPIFGQHNPSPTLQTQEYRFRLHEHPKYEWMPKLKAQDFITLLSNLTAIRIRGTYNIDGIGVIDNISMKTAHQGFSGELAWVEQCRCPEGYVGQFCESCAPGYRRYPPYSGPFARCVPCECHGHSDDCEVNSGRCICVHNTDGKKCERCISGYYGDARIGTKDDCKPCPCPNGGSCTQFSNKQVVCLDCPQGYGGDLCNHCLDGHFGDPTARHGIARSCEECSCNGNVDPNAVGNCNGTTGECLKCIYNSAGFYCEKCLPNYYGDALALPKGQCTACDCNPSGTISAGVLSCDPTNGQCPCSSFVQGQKCDECEEGYWNLDSGNGCQTCNCDPTGSLSNTCDFKSGQCQCKQGVTGQRCDQCQLYHFGFSPVGCQPCNCDQQGSTDLQCNESGFCPCRPAAAGQKCDHCQENKYNLTAGCVDCPVCYNLVQDKVNRHRRSLRELRNKLDDIRSNPAVFNDTEFVRQMIEVNASVNTLLNDARGIRSVNGTLERQLKELRNSITDVMAKSQMIADNIQQASVASKGSVSFVDDAEEAIDRGINALMAAENYITNEGKDAVRRAKEAVKNFGLQSSEMTQIARRARVLSNRQMNEAMMIQSTAVRALNTSREALNLARETFNIPTELAREIQRLRKEHGDAGRLFDQTRMLASRAQNSAHDAYRKALNLFTEIKSMAVPNTDLNQLIEDGKQIQETAANIKEAANKLLKQNTRLLREVDEEKRKAENLLEEGKRNKQEADRMLAEVFEANTKAKNAKKRGDMTLKQAQDTLKMLNDFDKQVQESKNNAENALKKVPEIENLIKESEEKTEAAHNALGGAKSDAKMALDLAEKAESTAHDASNEARDVQNNTKKSKIQAVKIKNKTNELAIELRNVEATIQDYENNATNETSAAKNALGMAGRAILTSDDAWDKVSKSLEIVYEIMKILGDLEITDRSKLDNLEEELNELEKGISGLNLDAQIAGLTNATTQLKTSVAQSSDDLAQLRKDVKNIEEISEALPKGCFKPTKLEIKDLN